jgi:arsenite-transporting ATPase
MLSSLHGLNVDLAIINKVIPEEVSDPYFSKWIELQRKYLSEAEESFYPLPIKKLILFDSELRGIEMLKRSGDELFIDEDPTKVYFKGSPIKIVCKEKELTLIVRVPFTSKKQINDIERIGDDLLIKVSTEVGDVVKVVPLPASALRMKLSKAKLLNDELQISFVGEHERKGEGCG